MISSLRRKLKYILPAVILILVSGLVFSRVFQPEPGIPQPEITITSHEAHKHVGKAAEVCGWVANARYIPHIDGQPTFINFERPDPNQTLTAVIWGENRSKWEHHPENIYPENEVCITGRIESHEGIPQIEVLSPDQIKLE